MYRKLVVCWNHVMSPEKALVMNSSCSRAFSDSRFFHSLRWCFANIFCKVPRFLDTKFPYFSSNRLELKGGKRPNAHFTASCLCRTFWSRRIAGKSFGLSYEILRFIVGFEWLPASSMWLAWSSLIVTPFFRMLKGFWNCSLSNMAAIEARLCGAWRVSGTSR